MREREVLHARGVRKAYGSPRRGGARTPVLHGVDLWVRRGEFVAIVGPSGSGKSTLLHCLSGLQAVDEGRVVVCGEVISEANANARALVRRRHVGFIFQDLNLVESLTVRQNVELPLRVTGRSRQLSQIGSTLEAVGVSDKENRYPGELSGGERQRVAIARVLASGPDMVFADEPTGALDSRNGTVVMNLLHEVTRMGGTTIMVTHDLDLAATADRVVVLRDGKVRTELAETSSDEILHHMAV